MTTDVDIPNDKQNKSKETNHFDQFNSDEALREAMELDKLVKELSPRIILQTFITKELEKGLSRLKFNKKKKACDEIILSIVKKSVKKSKKCRKHDMIKKLNRDKSVLRERLRYSETLINNLKIKIQESKKTTTDLYMELKLAKKEQNIEEIKKLTNTIEDFKRELNKQKKYVEHLKNACASLKEKNEKLNSEVKSKDQKLNLLSKSLEQTKDKAERKISDRFRHEQQRIDEIIKLHKDETEEYEEIIRKRDEDIKDLYEKLSQQDETIRKMGKSLLSLSRKEEDFKLKKSLEEANLEIMKLKSRIANLTEVKDGQPESIHTALQKGFRIEKDYFLLKEKNAILTKETETQKSKLIKMENELEKIEKSFRDYKDDAERRTEFYRNMTHSILQKCKELFSGKGDQARVSGLEEMYEILTRCEKSELATPRLKRIVQRFEHGKSASAPRSGSTTREIKIGLMVKELESFSSEA